MVSFIVKIIVSGLNVFIVLLSYHFYYEHVQNNYNLFFYFISVIVGCVALINSLSFIYHCIYMVKHVKRKQFSTKNYYDAETMKRTAPVAKKVHQEKTLPMKS